MRSVAAALEAALHHHDADAVRQAFAASRPGAVADPPARFDEDAVRVELSAGGGGAPSAAARAARVIETSLAELGGAAARLFAVIGMPPQEAAQAAASLAGAVRAEVMRTGIASSVTAEEPPVEQALVVEEAVLRWDQERGGYVTAVQRVAVAVEVENGWIVPRGAQQDLRDPGKRIAVLRLDAAQPLHLPRAAPGAAKR